MLCKLLISHIPLLDVSSATFYNYYLPITINTYAGNIFSGYPICAVIRQRKFALTAPVHYRHALFFETNLATLCILLRNHF